MRLEISGNATILPSVIEKYLVFDIMKLANVTHKYFCIKTNLKYVNVRLYDPYQSQMSSCVFT